MSFFLDVKPRISLKISTFIFTLLCAFIPYGYYFRCEAEASFTILSVDSIWFYAIIFYLCLSVAASYFNKGYFILLFDVFLYIFVMVYVVIIEIIGPMIHGLLSEIFGGLEDSLMDKGPCSAGIVFHYQWGYLFYVLAVGSFCLSTVLGLIAFLADRRRETH